MIRPLKPLDVEPYHPTVADIETRSDGSLIMIGMGWQTTDGLGYRTFETWGEWLDWLRLYGPGNARLRKIYAHNGGGFDWLSLLQYVVQNGLADDVKVIYTDSIVIGINVRFGKLRLQLRDSLRLLPASLAKLSATFDVDVKKIHIDVLPEQLYGDDIEAFLDYLKADVQALQMVLYRFWVAIVEAVGSIGELPMTLAALAMRLWQMTLDAPIMTPWGENLRTIERLAYSGGRTECFRAGTFDVSIYDINSQYPSVMLAHDFPTSYRGYWVDEYEGDHGVYTGTFSQPASDLPPLLRDGETGCFVRDGSGTFTMPEVRRLLELGGTFRCTRGYVYVDVGNPFESFIGRWWEVRQAAISRGDDALAFTCKILMNSLYGKFAQRDTGHVCMLATPEQRGLMLDKGAVFEDHGDFIIAEESLKVEHGFTGLAAYITAYARLALYDVMEAAITAGGTVVYCDTDSAHVVGAELGVGNGLGELKIEDAGTYHYAGKKLYAKADNSRIKSKGIGRLERGPLTAGDVARVAMDRGARHAVAFSAFPTWREVLLGGQTACRLIGRERTIRNTAPLPIPPIPAILMASYAGSVP